MVADPGGEIALDGDEAAVRQGRKSGEAIVIVFRLGGCRCVGDRLRHIDMFSDRLQGRGIDDENTGRAARLRRRLRAILNERIFGGGDQSARCQCQSFEAEIVLHAPGLRVIDEIGVGQRQPFDIASIEV